MEEAMVEALLCGEKEKQILGAKRVSKLSGKEKHKLCDRVVEPLVLMLYTEDCEAIEAALIALLSLAYGSERNKIRIAKSRVLPVLLKLMHCQNQPLFELSIAALLILSSCSANKTKIAASGAIQVLVQSLTTNTTTTTSLQAKLDIISTLHNLSTSHQIIPSIVFSDITSSLVQLIYGYDKSSQLVEKAMGLLERMVSLSEIALKEAASLNGGIQALVEALEEGSNLCKEYAVGILVMICKSCREKNRGLILREGVMPGLLQLSVDGTGRGKEMARTLLLLLRDCSNCGSRRRHWNSVLLEKAMQKIDEDERVGVALRVVEETIAKLSSA